MNSQSCRCVPCPLEIDVLAFLPFSLILSDERTCDSAESGETFCRSDRTALEVEKTFQLHLKKRFSVTVATAEATTWGLYLDFLFRLSCLS